MDMSAAELAREIIHTRQFPGVLRGAVLEYAQLS
jgi:hypothetical protein